MINSLIFFSVLLSPQVLPLEAACTKTKKVQMEERNVYCGAYFTKVLLNKFVCFIFFLCLCTAAQFLRKQYLRREFLQKHKCQLGFSDELIGVWWAIGQRSRSKWLHVHPVNANVICREFLLIWYNRLVGFGSKLISFWWPKVEGQCQELMSGMLWGNFPQWSSWTLLWTDFSAQRSKVKVTVT